MTDTIEPWLTRDAGKLAHFRDDPYFWEGWASYVAGRPAAAVLRHLTFLLVKPEAIVGRRVAPILEFLQSGGHRIVGTWPVRLGRHEARGLWRYSLNMVPIAHIRALEMLVTAGELFLVGIDRPLTSGEASAAEQLSRAKGSSARPDARGTLRECLGCPALMLNFVHAPDEPADVLRELAVLCDAPEQERIITTLLAADRWPPARFEAAAREAAAIMTSRYADSPAHDLDVTATLKRMRARLGDSALRPQARAAIESGETSPEHALDVVRSLADATELPHWDRIVTAAHLVDGLRTGRSPLIR
jgi:nucleoside diphosphate kinase